MFRFWFVWEQGNMSRFWFFFRTSKYVSVLICLRTREYVSVLIFFFRIRKYVPVLICLKKKGMSWFWFYFRKKNIFRFWFVWEQGNIPRFWFVWEQGNMSRVWVVWEKRLYPRFYLWELRLCSYFLSSCNRGIYPSLVLIYEQWFVSRFRLDYIPIKSCLWKRNYAPITNYDFLKQILALGKGKGKLFITIICWNVDFCYIFSCLGDDEWCYWLICLCWPSSSCLKFLVLVIYIVLPRLLIQSALANAGLINSW